MMGVGVHVVECAGTEESRPKRRRKSRRYSSLNEVAMICAYLGQHRVLSTFDACRLVGRDPDVMSDWAAIRRLLERVSLAIPILDRGEAAGTGATGVWRWCEEEDSKSPR